MPLADNMESVNCYALKKCLDILNHKQELTFHVLLYGVPLHSKALRIAFGNQTSVPSFLIRFNLYKEEGTMMEIENEKIEGFEN